jgi:acetyl esterase/lipase
MTCLSGIDWEDAFDNVGHIPGSAEYPECWAKRAAAFRERMNGRIDIAYGDQPRERFDLFLPDAAPKGLAVFVHGGYWIRFDKSDWSDLAAGALAHGWAVAMPGYTLAPDIRIGGITQQIGRAISAAAKMVPGPIRLSGHSAGGHLATRMVCEDTPLAAGIAERIERIVSISGLHDLRPLRLHSMNTKLHLDEGEATAESAALHTPLRGFDVTAWVGAGERPEYLRQSALLTEAWGNKGLNTQLVADPGRHHFNVIDGLKIPDHPLARAFAGE